MGVLERDFARLKEKVEVLLGERGVAGRRAVRLEEVTRTVDRAVTAVKTIGRVAWDNVTGKPSTFPPTAHTHPITAVAGLEEALANKASSSHSHAWNAITDKPTAFPPEAHTHDFGEITGSLTVAWGDISGKPSTFPPEAHSHATSDVTGLDAALAGKAASSHSHSDATTSAAGFMSATDKTKLDGVAAGANNYTHPSGDGNRHVPATGTGNNGKFLKAGATAASEAWTAILKADVTGLSADLSNLASVVQALAPAVFPLVIDLGDTIAATGYLPFLEGDAMPGATVTVTVDGGSPHVATADLAGRWSMAFDDVRANGAHALVATQATVLGALAGSASATLTIAAYEAETWAILDRWDALGTPASKARSDALDSLLVKPLKAEALWARLRCLYTPQHSVAATLVNLFAPAESLTQFNSPSVIPDTSFGGDGVASYFNTGINLLTNGGAYQQDSAFMFVWSLTDLSAGTATDMGSGVTARIVSRNGANGTYNANAANRTFPNANSEASYGWTRRSSTEQVAFRNGAVVDTHTQASSAIPNANLLIGQRGSSTFSARQFAAIAAGGSLPTDTDIANLTAIVGDYLTHLGAI